jgi:hypothetical protein
MDPATHQGCEECHGFSVGISLPAILWMKRACAVIKIGYPDLAAGDAFKALVLLKQAPARTK